MISKQSVRPDNWAVGFIAWLDRLLLRDDPVCPFNQ
jgi:hypothetical protein